METVKVPKVYKLNRTALKYVAIICMLIDHVGMLFLPPTSSVLGIFCRVLGRITCPGMCLFIAEGFRHTSSKRNYLIRLITIAFASQLAYTFAHYGTIYTYELFTDYNVIFTLAISFITLLAYDNIKNYFLKWCGIACLVALSYFCDWGIFAPIFVLAFYILHNNKNKQALAFSIIALFVVAFAVVFCIVNNTAWYGELWQLGLFMFIPLLYFYNGERGSSNTFNKWLFYAFYPIHLALIGLIALYV